MGSVSQLLCCKGWFQCKKGCGSHWVMLLYAGKSGSEDLISAATVYLAQPIYRWCCSQVPMGMPSLLVLVYKEISSPLPVPKIHHAKLLMHVVYPQNDTWAHKTPFFP